MNIASLKLVFLLFHARMLLLPLQEGVVQSLRGLQDRGCAAAEIGAALPSGQDALKAASLHWVRNVCREGPDGVVKLFYLVYEHPLVPVSHLALSPGAFLCALLSVSAPESLQNVPFHWSEIYPKHPAGLQDRSCEGKKYLCAGAKVLSRQESFIWEILAAVGLWVISAIWIHWESSPKYTALEEIKSDPFGAHYLLSSFQWFKSCAPSTYTSSHRG